MSIRPSVIQVRELGDVARVYQWHFTLMEPPKAMAGAPTRGEMNLRLESVDVPNMTDQKITVQIRGQQVHHHGIHTYPGQLNLTMFETGDSKVTKWLRNWREICWKRETGTHHPKAQIEAVCRITALDVLDKPRYTWDFYGCFLEDYQLGTFDGSTSDAVRPTMTLSYDYMLDDPA